MHLLILTEIITIIKVQKFLFNRRILSMGIKILKKASSAIMSAALMLNCAAYSAPAVIAADAPRKFEFEDAKYTPSMTSFEVSWTCIPELNR